MSATKYYREAFCRVLFNDAVSLFHESRKRSENVDVALSDLARRCANTAFAEKAAGIVGDKETCARLFMKVCRERFPDEIRKALTELPEKEEIAA